MYAFVSASDVAGHASWVRRVSYDEYVQCCLTTTWAEIWRKSLKEVRRAGGGFERTDLHERVIDVVLHVSFIRCRGLGEVSSEEGSTA